jgi:hypothetical protein
MLAQEATWEVLHPEAGRYLSWLKSNAFAIEQGLNPNELGGCVTPFAAVFKSMLEALQPKPGLTFARSLVEFEGPPPLALQATRFLEKHLYEEGVFRVPGSTEVVQALKRRYDEDGGEGAWLLALEGPERPSPHDVATLYKLLLRELPHPLIPATATRTLLETRAMADGDFVRAVRAAAQSFHPTHAQTLRLLLALLFRINLCSDVNKMTAKNLGVCFAPSVLRSGDSEDLALQDIQPAITLVTRMIEHAEDLYPDTLWEGYPVT